MAVERLLKYCGLHPHQYWLLVKNFIVMDLRSQYYSQATGTKPGEAIPPLFWVIGQYLFISAIISTVLFGRVEVWAYAFVGLATSILLTVTAVMVEFNEVVLNNDDIDILGHRPITQRTYAASRLTNLGFYVVLITLALNIFPATIGVALKDSSLWYFPIYWLAAFLGNIVAVCLVILLYSLASPVQGQKDFRDMLAWTQIVLAMVVFYGAQLMLRDSSHAIEIFLSDPPSWVQWLPPAYLANFITRLTYTPPQTIEQSLEIISWLGMALFAVALIGATTLYRLAQFYAAIPASRQENAAHATRITSGPFAGRLVRLLAASPQQAVSLALCLKMLRRDHELRMRMIPSLAMVFAAVAMGFFTQQLENGFTGGQEKSILSIATVQLLVLAIPSLMYSMSFSRDWAAAWILLATPTSTPRLHAESCRQAACFGVALPVMLLLFACFAWVWQSPAWAALHCGLGWLTLIAVSHWSLLVLPLQIPFARSISRGELTGPIAPFLAVVSLLVMTLGIAQYWAGTRHEWLWGYCLGIGLLFVISKVVAQKIVVGSQTVSRQTE